jgi:hypothetical protein
MIGRTIRYMNLMAYLGIDLASEAR